MNKQTSEKEQDIKNQEPEVEATQEGGATEANANMAEEEQAATDNMSVEPSLEEQLAVWRDKYLRLQAEFDNFRKRTIKEKMELVERGCESAWKAVLPILDDMERAVEASKKSDDIEALRQGEELVMKKFESVFQSANITAIDCVGKPFNEEEQEAVARFAAGEDKRGLVIDCVQRGYKLGDHILRYAKVVVGE
ncbi:MAG: nucleotide exchange factor GrpE [Alistipes sp.]|nr:nucleotide exchange factor GrpE [Rikenellaceae bacterium]MBQ5829677.1 nucleotide exchange factor GrpE [Alistipes sp.]MBR2110572.1 nucleotide exchange factor GrpE [Alistipes sp.]MBR6631431.1 nucleotide exchange factor GrpE [Alistipes sp.]